MEVVTSKGNVMDNQREKIVLFSLLPYLHMSTPHLEFAGWPDSYLIIACLILRINERING